MGVLYAKVAGGWVPISGTATGVFNAAVDEVWVGPTAPVDPNVELWVDSDVPAALYARVAGNWVPVGGSSPASETVAGIIELATTSEVMTGTDHARAVTPSTLTQRVNALPWGVSAVGTCNWTLNTPMFNGQVLTSNLNAYTFVGRRYRLCFQMSLYNGSAALGLHSGGQYTGLDGVVAGLISYWTSAQFNWVTHGQGYNQGYSVHCHEVSGTPTPVSGNPAHGHWYLEDIGPMP